jgi:iron complex transport system substrate-binding protein
VKRVRNALCLALSFMIVVMLFVSCSPKEDPLPVDPDTSITVTDHLGRTVELPGPAQRVIGTHNPSMNMVVVLDGNGSRIAGFGSKDMSYGIYDVIAPEIETVTQIGKGKELNIETVISVEPDLLIIPARFQSSIEQMDELNIPCIALDVEKFDSIKSALLLVGKAIGQEERAQTIVQFYDEMISKMDGIAKAAEEKPRVLMLSKSSPTAVSTDAMLQNLMIETAGGTNVTAGFQPDELWTEVDIEQIIAWNPDVIYVPVYATYTVEDILNDPQWASISAVKNKKVYRFPSTLEPWDYPVAASCLGLCWVTYNLHPEIYSFEDLMEDVDRYYQFVYGRTFDVEEFGFTD